MCGYGWLPTDDTVSVCGYGWPPIDGTVSVCGYGWLPTDSTVSVCGYGSPTIDGTVSLCGYGWLPTDHVIYKNIDKLYPCNCILIFIVYLFQLLLILNSICKITLMFFAIQMYDI